MSYEILKKWQGEIIPFVVNFGEVDGNSRGLYSAINFKKDIIVAEDYNGLFVSASCVDNEDCCYTYGRRIRFAEKGLGFKNREVGLDIARKLERILGMNNFEVGFGKHPFDIPPLNIGFAFRGYGNVEMFDDFISMAGVVDGFINEELGFVYNNLERPYVYAFVGKEDSTSEETVGLFRDISEGLDGAVGVLKTAINPRFEEEEIYLNEDSIAELCGKFAGKYLGLDEFLAE